MNETRFTDPETAKRWKPAEGFNWNRKIHVPKVWAGMVEKIPPAAVEALISQGRKDFIPIDAEAVPKKSKPLGPDA